jgi:hypothetical protein
LRTRPRAYRFISQLDGGVAVGYFVGQLAAPKQTAGLAEAAEPVRQERKHGTIDPAIHLALPERGSFQTEASRAQARIAKCLHRTVSSVA